jgi:16S rRNA processing protein RimM
MSNHQYLECGKIQNTHGIHGALKVEPYCDSPKVLAGLSVVYLCKNGSYMPLQVVKAGCMQDRVLMQFSGFDDPEHAAALKNEIIYARREDIPLPEGSYFLADVPGLAVIDADSGRQYGTVSRVCFIGGRDYFAVQTATSERLLPVLPAFVAYVDVERGVFVRPIPGLLEDAPADNKTEDGHAL